MLHRTLLCGQLANLRTCAHPQLEKSLVQVHLEDLDREHVATKHETVVWSSDDEIHQGLSAPHLTHVWITVTQLFTEFLFSTVQRDRLTQNPTQHFVVDGLRQKAIRARVS